MFGSVHCLSLFHEVRESSDYYFTISYEIPIAHRHYFYSFQHCLLNYFGIRPKYLRLEKNVRGALRSAAQVRSIARPVMSSVPFIRHPFLAVVSPSPSFATPPPLCRVFRWYALAQAEARVGTTICIHRDVTSGILPWGYFFSSEEQVLRDFCRSKFLDVEESKWILALILIQSLYL